MTTIDKQKFLDYDDNDRQIPSCAAFIDTNAVSESLKAEMTTMDIKSLIGGTCMMEEGA